MTTKSSGSMIRPMTDKPSTSASNSLSLSINDEPGAMSKRNSRLSKLNLRCLFFDACTFSSSSQAFFADVPVNRMGPCKRSITIKLMIRSARSSFSSHSSRNFADSSVSFSFDVPVEGDAGQVSVPFTTFQTLYSLSKSLQFQVQL